MESRPPRRVHNDILIFGEVWEFDEVTFEFDMAGVSPELEVDVEDVERRKAGIRYRVGKEDGQFQLSIFGERLDVDFETLLGVVQPSEDEVDLLALEVGAAGVPRFIKGRVVSPLMDYSIAISLHGGEGDDFFDDFYYLEARGHLGVGVEAFGVQATAGVAASAFAGAFDTQSAIENAGLEGDTFVAANLGGYLRIGYRAAHFPLYVDVRGFVGNVQGVTAAIGVRI